VSKEQTACDLLQPKASTPSKGQTELRNPPTQRQFPEINIGMPNPGSHYFYHRCPISEQSVGTAGSDRPELGRSLLADQIELDETSEVLVRLSCGVA
jgi:hypothetical protein